MLENRIQSAILKGLEFLKQEQLPSGEFPTYVSKYSDMSQSRYIKTISMSVLNALSLKEVNKNKITENLIRKSVDYLVNEKEEEATWRYFGKGSNIIPDYDDICYTLALLKTNHVKMDYRKIADDLLKNHRNDNNIFYTWYPEKGDANNVDWVTNTNILYFLYSFDGITILPVEEYIKTTITSNEFLKGSLYYPSPNSFLYFLSRLYNDRKVANFNPIMPRIHEYISEEQEDSIQNKIFSLNISINTNFTDNKLKNLVVQVLDSQENNGNWKIGSIFKHKTFDQYYGSEGLFTSMAIEGLSKYMGLKH